jgi:hypothetical protein
MQKEIKILKAQNEPLTQGDEIRFFNNYAYLIPPGYVELPENEWKGRMIINIDRSDPNFNEVGKTGGNKTHTQSENGVAPHVHRVGGQDNSAQPRSNASNEVVNIEDYGTSADYFHRKTSANLVGNTVMTKADPMDIMNLYRVVLFIKWVGLP